MQKLTSFFNLLSALCHLPSLKYFSAQQQWVLFFIALFILGTLYFKFYDSPPPLPKEEFFKEIVVEVSGEVKNPGVYLFQNSPTLKEAIEKAGGLKEKAQIDATALSETLETGSLLTITKEPYLIPPHPPLPKEGHGGIKREDLKVRIGRMTAHQLLVFSIPLDLNRVSFEDLCLIPGIGESLAQEIITYRKRNKGFRSVEALKEVKGIGEKKWKELKNYFIVQ